MTKIYKLNEIEITEDQVRQLIKDHPELLEKKGGKPWRGARHETYFTIESGVVFDTFEENDLKDSYRYLSGTYFQTKKQALAYKARQEAIGRVTHKILELNDGWEANWEQPADNWKYGIYYTPNVEHFQVDYHYYRNYAPVLPHMASREIAEQIIKDHEADLKIIFNIK